MPASQGHVYFELKRVGMYLRCTAIDERTGVEVMVAGPARGGEEMIKRTAYQKLQYVLNKKAAEQSKRR